MSSESFSYPKPCYDIILKTVQEKFGLKNTSLEPHMWNVWRRRIKEMFDEGIIISEILLALNEAAQKKMWPQGTAFWHRVKDVVLKNRLEHRRATAVKEDEGMVDIHSLLQRRLRNRP